MLRVAKKTIYFVQIELIYPQACYVEIDPDKLWEDFVAVVNEAIDGKRRLKFPELCHLIKFVDCSQWSPERFESDRLYWNFNATRHDPDMAFNPHPLIRQTCADPTVII